MTGAVLLDRALTVGQFHRTCLFLWRILIVCLGFIGLSRQVMINKPRNTIGINGTRIEFQCSPWSNQSISWRYVSLSSSNLNVIHNGRSTNQNYSTDKNASLGQCNLVIPSLRDSYAGSYQCAMMNNAEIASAELVVIVTRKCDFNGSSDDSFTVVAGVNVTLRCEIRFAGRYDISVKWRDDMTRMSLVEHADKLSHDTVESRFQFQAPENIFTWKNVTCFVTFSDADEVSIKSFQFLTIPADSSHSSSVVNFPTNNSTDLVGMAQASIFTTCVGVASTILFLTIVCSVLATTVSRGRGQMGRRTGGKYDVHMKNNSAYSGSREAGFHDTTLHVQENTEVYEYIKHELSNSRNNMTTAVYEDIKHDTLESTGGRLLGNTAIRAGGEMPTYVQLI